MAKAKYLHNDLYPQGFVGIMCPGCGHVHALSVQQMESGRPVWGFNDDMDKQTFTPSLKVSTGIYVPGHEDWRKKIPLDDQEDYIKNSSICHSFITNGRIQFLSDCTHALAGQTVDLPELL